MQSRNTGDGNLRDVTYNNVLTEAHPGRVHAKDRSDAVVAGVVEELLPAIEGYVGIIVAANCRAGIIHLNKVLGSFDRLLGWDVGVLEGALWSMSVDGSLFSVVSVSIEMDPPPRSPRFKTQGRM